MAKHLVSLTLNAQGAGDVFTDALHNAKSRLVTAAQRIAAGDLPEDPGVTLDQRDPGGGPCAPQKIAIDIILDQDILPEAQSDDDD